MKQIDSKRTWQVMKKITGKHKTKSIFSPKKTNLIKPLYKIDKTLLKNLKNFFIFVVPKFAENISNTEKTFEHFVISHNEKMQFEELNFEEFREAFKILKRNKAVGFDDLSSNIVIDACDSLKNILFHVFKVSIQ